MFGDIYARLGNFPACRNQVWTDQARSDLAVLMTLLAIKDLRVIREMRLEPGPGINFIVGGNGAGKTSVLEAVYLAGRGRTFRHASAGPMIRRGSDASIVRVHFRDDAGGEGEHRLGLQRGKTDFICRLDGETVHRRSELAQALPLQWLGSQPQLFLERGPEWRRRFFDMGLFHVEHDYLAIHAELARALKQRNAALKSASAAQVTPWNDVFVKAARALDAQSAAFVDLLCEKAKAIIADWDLGFGIDAKYRRGWREGEALEAALARKLELDVRMGFTSVGPQRAEIELLTDGSPAERTLSRGQQKMLVFALNLAMIDVMTEKRGRRPVVLVDDLAAELDHQNQARIITALLSRNAQVLVTSIAEPEDLCPSAGNVFHVEHGELVR